MKKIALLWDQFDPINLEQIEYARTICKKDGFDFVWFVCLENEKLHDFSFRDQLIRIQIRPFRKLGLVSYESDNLIECIQQLPKENKYTLLWNSYCKQFYKKEQLQPYINLVKAKQSTIDPECIQKGDFSTLSKPARRFIIESGQYAESILKNRVNEKRYLHSLSVAKLSAEIAMANHLDAYKAWLAGMYHDIAKGMKKDQLAEYMNIRSPYEKDYDYHVWHQYVGMHVLKYEYKMKDQIILNAVRHHCLGDSNEKYAAILYMADKLDPSRGYDSSKEIELAKRDIEAAYRLVHQQQDDYLEKTGVK